MFPVVVVAIGVVCVLVILAVQNPESEAGGTHKAVEKKYSTGSGDGNGEKYCGLLMGC
jgi:hypothetical protein